MTDNDRGFALGPDPMPTQHYIDMRDAIIAGLKQDIATLQSQLQSVTAIRERCAKENAALEQENAALKAERDAARQSRARLVRLVRALRAELETAWGIEAQAEAEREAMQAERDAARQSRARLVGHVCRLRAKFSETMPDSAFVKRITDERNAARAWAAAWKRAAKLRRARVGYRQDVEWLRVDRRNRRARRAAEAVERR